RLQSGFDDNRRLITDEGKAHYWAGPFFTFIRAAAASLVIFPSEYSFNTLFFTESSMEEGMPHCSHLVRRTLNTTISSGPKLLRVLAYSIMFSLMSFSNVGYSSVTFLSRWAWSRS